MVVLIECQDPEIVETLAKQMHGEVAVDPDGRKRIRLDNVRVIRGRDDKGTINCMRQGMPLAVFQGDAVKDFVVLADNFQAEHNIG